MSTEYCETECQHQRCEACARVNGKLYRPAIRITKPYFGGRQSGYAWLTRCEENTYFDELENSRNIQKNRR